MKHPKRTLIALLICVVGLVAVLLGLHFAPTGGSSSSSESDLQTTSLYSHKDSDLISMTVKNAAGTYTIVPDKEATAKAASQAAASASAAAASVPSASSSSASSAAQTKTVFKINELSGLTTNSETIGTAAQDGYSLSALKTIGSAESLADYGLKDPAATFTSTFSDGSKVTVLIGNETPLDTSARYVKLEGKETIYAATIAENLTKGISSYISTQVTSIPTVSSAPSTASGTAATAASFTKIDIRNAGGSFGLARSGSNWLVNSRPADSTKVETLTSALSSISASSVEALDPTADQLKKYGLSSPASELTYTSASGTGTILIGSLKAADTSSTASSESDNGTYYYVMLKGGRMVYLVSSNGMPWLTEKAFDMQRMTLVTSAQTQIAGVSLQGSGADYQMVVSRAKNESSSTEDVPSYTYTTQLNGKKLSDEKTFAAFYSKITSMKILEDSTDTPSGSPAYTLTLNGFDGEARQIYQFYKASERRYLVTANGVACGLVNSTDVDALLTAAKAVK